MTSEHNWLDNFNKHYFRHAFKIHSLSLTSTGNKNSDECI